MKIITLTKITFDNSENGIAAAINETELGKFVDGDGLSASGNASKFIQNLPPEKHYSGWDGEVYPKYVLTSSESL